MVFYHWLWLMFEPFIWDIDVKVSADITVYIWCNLVCVYILSWQVQGIQICDLLLLGIVHIFGTWICHFWWFSLACILFWELDLVLLQLDLLSLISVCTFQPSIALFFILISILESLRIFSMHLNSFSLHLSLSCSCTSCCAFFFTYFAYIVLVPPSVLSDSGSCSSLLYCTACFTTEYFFFVFQE